MPVSSTPADRGAVDFRDRLERDVDRRPMAVDRIRVREVHASADADHEMRVSGVNSTRRGTMASPSSATLICIAQRSCSHRSMLVVKPSVMC